MKRLVVTLLALGLLAFCIVTPALLWDRTTAQATYEPTSISSYLADFTLEEDGDLKVIETITVEFPLYGDRHGIFRFWDRHDANAPRLRREPQDLSVLRDGREEPFVLERRERGRFDVARIGSAYATVQGPHTYQISYLIEDALLPAGEGSRFYWNLVPGGWLQDIASARLLVHLPAEATGVRCARGNGETGGCEATGEGTRTLRVDVDDLPSQTPITISADLPIAAPTPDDQRLWSQKWDAVLGPHILGVLLLLGAGLASALVALRAVRNAHEPKPPYPLLYAPPQGVGPAQGQYVLTEQVHDTAFVATLMEAAEKGAIDLDRRGNGWQIQGRGPASTSPLDAVTTATTTSLGVAGDGSFTADRDSIEAGKVLQSAKAQSTASIKEWARNEGLMTSAGLGSLGGFSVIAAAVVTVLVVVLNPLDISLLALVPGAYAACGLWLLTPGSGTKRTASGRELWSQLGGFHRVLSTPSSQLRFDFSGRKELYTAYLPWAVAFGVADQWAAKYRTEIGTEPPAPAYFATGYTGTHTGNHVNQMVNDFERTVDGAISSYQASQRPQSSGSGGGFSGGGFSGGGGGGGGGGGSW
ncbi:hypothetical protein CF8_0637 [Nocardioides sp. CF8]|uniref:DUF2207 domain-containing protein n=1 Tax=Nocardioides sp. CF8 TaxID=110319 RepID=UPI00032EF58E|nr:DUF2207 domain-containing protein [Nocardioides sp. CF8]EON25286.1 hypothetical protein CF8_0637 [Nocardioides sp. CF8]